MSPTPPAHGDTSPPFIVIAMNLELHLTLLIFLPKVFLELSYNSFHLYDISWSPVISKPGLPFRVDAPNS